MVAKGVVTVTEGPRGCGYRKQDGVYLISEGVSVPCPALPLEVSRCPCCDSGIKPTRSWAWFNPSLFFKFPCPVTCARYQESGRCEPFKQERAGILWIGGKFYPTPADWMRESNEMGVSRRISQIPKDLKIGETWVFVGHRKAVEVKCECTKGDLGGAPLVDCEECDGEGVVYKPGLFHAFKPTRIEKVVHESIEQKEVDKLLKKGITPVIVNRVDKDGNPVDEQGNPIEDPHRMVPMPTEEGYYEKVTDILNKDREAQAAQDEDEDEVEA